MKSVLFFTCANKIYEHYVLPYVFSALYSVDNSLVEICLENSDEFKKNNIAAIEQLRNIIDDFDQRVLFRDGNFKDIIPNSVRFVETPLLKAEYLYIGDIDIFILDTDLVEQHTNNMKDTGLPYSNIVRPNDKSKMTGLHFSQYNAYYPIPDISDLDLASLNDEMLLCEIVKRKGLKVPDFPKRFRPTHGLHFSIRRAVRGSSSKPSWGLTSDKTAALTTILKSNEWLSLSPYISGKFISNINVSMIAAALDFPSKKEDAIVKYWDHKVSTIPEKRLTPNKCWTASRNIRASFQDNLQSLNVQTLADVGCGIVDWILYCSGSLSAYYGLDISEKATKRNNEYISLANHYFKIFDVRHELIPKVDMVILRDVLNFYSTSDILKILNLIKSANPIYIGLTNYPRTARNREGTPNQLSLINFMKPPYLFPEPIFETNEKIGSIETDQQSKTFAIWKFSDIASALNGN